MKIATVDLVSELVTRTNSFIEIAEKSFLPLNENQINWKPDIDSWSIGECLEHLNMYGDYYIPAISEGIHNGANTKPSEKFKPGWLGNYSANAMLPREGVITNKMKSPKDKNPALSTVPRGVVERFINQQKDILTLLEESGNVSMSKVRVPISIGRFIKFKLGDTFRFIIYHNERHIIQAENVYKALKASKN
ncbi:MAG: DinB family protein [Bacteroidota bacterium]